MKLPSNTWCPGSGKAAVGPLDKPEFARCPDCGYQFRFFHGVTPQHRPKFSQKS